MNTTPDYIVAVEIGSSKIKGAVGRKDASGALSVIGIEDEHLQPNCVRYGCVQNVKEVANVLNQVITRLNSRLQPAGSHIGAVYLGVGGRSLKATPAELGTRLNEVTEVTPEIVSRLLQRAQVGGADTELLDVEAMAYQVDGKNQGADPVGVLGSEISAKVNIVSCRKRLILNMEKAVNEKLGLKINGYVVRPMAIADLVLTGDEKRLGVMLVDCGAETSTVAIYKGGVLHYLATIPLGSRHITRDLTTLPYTEEKAEDLKRTFGNANADENAGGSIDETDTTAINNIVRARAAEIVANIAAQTGYAKFANADLPQGIVLVGGGADLQGFAEILASATGMPVRRGSLPPTVRVTASKISTGADVDVISLLARLATEPRLKPCVAPPADEKPAEGDAPFADTADDPEDWENVDEIEKNKGGFFSSLWSKMKKATDTPSSLDNGGDDDEDESFT